MNKVVHKRKSALIKSYLKDKEILKNEQNNWITFLLLLLYEYYFCRTNLCFYIKNAFLLGFEHSFSAFK